MRDSGELVVVGITEEQHPDRCRLFAQWKGFDWPILWDPFNLTGSSSVPLVLLVDEHGVVRADRMHPERFEVDYLQQDFPAPSAEPPLAPPAVRRALLDEPGRGADEHNVAFAGINIVNGNRSCPDRLAIET